MTHDKTSSQLTGQSQILISLVMDESEEPMESSLTDEHHQSNVAATPPVVHTTDTMDTPISSLKEDTTTVDSISESQFHSPHIQQLSLAEYHRQAGDYTQQALRELKASPEYKQHTQQCYSCGARWYNGQWSESCKECGGYGMQRPCPICRGYCGRMWTRSVDMSHTMCDSHWDGKCGHQQAALLLKEMVTFTNLSEAMEDLQT